MSRLTTIRPEEATGAAAEVFAKIKKAVGKVPNAYATIGTHSPEALSAALAFDAAVDAGTLGKADIEVIKLAVSEHVGCDYCVAAHTLKGKLAGLSSDDMKQVLFHFYNTMEGRRIIEWLADLTVRAPFPHVGSLKESAALAAAKHEARTAVGYALLRAIAEGEQLFAQQRSRHETPA